MTGKPLPDLEFRESDRAEEVVARLTHSIEHLVGDERYRDSVNRAVPGARVVYGVRVPQLRDLARQVLRVFGKDADMVETIAEACWQVDSREHRVLAILILAGLKRITPTRRWALGVRYLPEVGDWETCDQLCMGVLGQALAEDPALMERLEEWARSPNLWVRRAALASTVMLRRSKAPPEIRRSLDERALGICLRLIDDGEHYVRKAVDWAVREVLRRDYSLGRAWLMERSQSALSQVARSTLKKAAKKLTADDQGDFLRNLS